LELDPELESLLADLDDSGRHTSFRRPPHTIVVDPCTWKPGPFVKEGLVEFYREKRLDHFTTNISPAKVARVEGIFGKRRSELGIVDRKGNLFAVFADLENTVIFPGTLVEVEIGACPVPIKKLGHAFLCHRLKILPPSSPNDLL